jgi:hypothetical protein
MTYKAFSISGCRIGVPLGLHHTAPVPQALTPKIRAIADNHDFVKTPDNEGYFKYHQAQGCHIEIVSHDKVLKDAKKRNRAFFELLQIPGN